MRAHTLAPHPQDAIYTPIHQRHAETVFTAVSVQQNQRWCRLDDMVNMTSCPCVFFLLTAPGSCHPNAVLPAFITCWKAQHVTGRASWRVTGLINPVWQLPDALSGSSPPSLSRSHIPVSRGPITGMIYNLENGELWGDALELGLYFFLGLNLTLILNLMQNEWLP